MFRSSQIAVFIGVLFAGIIVAILYMLLDIYSPYDGDPCNPLICTPGYPCFDQGDCTHMRGE